MGEAMTGDRWVTFDCFGTLVDWHSGYRRILSPIAGDRTDELIRAFYAMEPPEFLIFPQKLLIL